MITGEIKNRVDAIWQKIWEGGITNPLEVITNITYLMFMRQLDEKELAAERMETLLDEPQKHIFPKTYENNHHETIQGSAMRWSSFKDKPAEEMYRIVNDFAFPFIKGLSDESAYSRAMANATFGFPENKPATLEKTVTGVDELLRDFDEHLSDLGDLYEYMLSTLSTEGTNGQFRTPAHIREMMVKMVDPKPGELICDPACGTAGFLISAAEHIRQNHESEMTEEQWNSFTGANGSPQFTGFEIDQTMLRISAMNLMLHEIEDPDVRYLDAVSKDNKISDKFDIVLANPPFKGTLDEEGVEKSLRAIVQSKQTELLFIALFIRMLKIGGRCACIVPNGVLSRDETAYMQIRKELVDNQKLEAVISMPSGVFQPYSNVKTAILVFTKTNAGGTNNVWFYDMENDGFSFSSKRVPNPEYNDIPDILNRWKNLNFESSRERSDKSFLVPKQEIVRNQYDFSFNKYAKSINKHIDYPPVPELLNELDDLNAQFTDGLSALRELLKESV